MPLEVTGESNQAVCAFARRKNQAWVIAVAPRSIGSAVYNGIVPLGDFWRSTAVSVGSEMANPWVNVITGEYLESTHAAATQALPLSRVLSHFPVALLYQEQVSTLSSLREETLHAAGVQHSTT